MLIKFIFSKVLNMYVRRTMLQSFIEYNFKFSFRFCCFGFLLTKLGNSC